MAASRVSAGRLPVHIDAPHGLVITWLWEHNVDALQMPVSVERFAQCGLDGLSCTPGRGG